MAEDPNRELCCHASRLILAGGRKIQFSPLFFIFFNHCTASKATDGHHAVFTTSAGTHSAQQGTVQRPLPRPFVPHRRYDFSCIYLFIYLFILYPWVTSTMCAADDGKGFPNNQKLPLLVYEQSVDLNGAADPAAVFERLVVKHQWGDAWRDGVYPYHHYHSTAHEGLGTWCLLRHHRTA
jgi:hypothetical protein